MSGHSHDLEMPGGLNLAERIRRLANGRNTIDVAQFQFIGLKDISAKYGERWQERREKVQEIARDFIAKRIAPEDVMIAGADGFLLVFGAYSGPLADAVAQRITTELNTFFVGAPDADPDIRFESRHRSMSVDDFAQAFGEMIAESHKTPVAPKSTAPDKPLMGYTPVWDSRRGAITTYFVTPLDAATGYPLDWATHHRHADMDELKLKASEDAIRQMVASNQKALVGVAVHVSSLNSQSSLARLYGALAKFDTRLARYRVVRITGVEPGFPRIYLEDIMRTLRARAPNIAIGLNWTEPDVASVLKLQPAAIGFTLPPGSLGANGPKVDLFARIHAAAELARHQAIPTGVEGDLHPEHAQRFAADGVQHMASWRIWPVETALPSARIWPASKLGGAAPPSESAA
jgi:hypothetical protein